MKISVMGLGYVGAVSAACLAADGHEVIGADVNSTKVNLLNSGRSPIVEPGLDALISENVSNGHLIATMNSMSAVERSELSLVCVGTPSKPNGNLDDQFIRQVCREIGEAVRKLGKKHTLVLRSTVLPGTMRTVVIPSLEQGFGGPIRGRIGVAFNPEFLREGTAIEDYRHPPKTVVGSDDENCANQVSELYSTLSAPLFKTPLEVAEMVKYVDNCWHALKVSYANEIGTICAELKIDSHAVMDIFIRDTKLNISPVYLRPGYAFGGSCLPKDVRALNYKARAMDLKLPILENILPSNSMQMDNAVRLVSSRNSRKVGILGLSFKPNTDDLRESPIVELVERLIGKGFDVRIFDSNVLLSRLLGANKEYLHGMIPHVESLLVDNLDAVLDHADTIVVGHSTSEFKTVPNRLRKGQVLIDLVRLSTRNECTGQYVGLSW